MIKDNIIEISSWNGWNYKSCNHSAKYFGKWIENLFVENSQNLISLL